MCSASTWRMPCLAMGNIAPHDSPAVAASAAPPAAPTRRCSMIVKLMSGSVAGVRDMSNSCYSHRMASDIHHPAVDEIELTAVMHALSDPARLEVVRTLAAESE